ncbi:phospholipase effector Tle1 domain-containing protein [Pseudoduganella namucuonensis]|uniref:Uncharacterized alpha/beta hydrolase domain n=1 Tax=Pseudoduganella namucuonensis TaxID=1035707 RepID=A0A1I7F631_9BURK|nr:DUF2235 domain-containing protein [Pseudoduganella namucuonensis]SFU31604.1 Uncharacterized alpha/beta hydrolase domain [Pseudoduganella namucuonensis]
MTAQLISHIPASYGAADVREVLFSDLERQGFRKREEMEQPPLGVPGASCTTNLFFGFFFDGTKNNYVQAEPGKNHSNVARLYDCFPGLSVAGVLPATTDWQYNPERYTHFFKTYIPGVASPFKEVGDNGEGIKLALGAGTGRGGQARIAWALMQAINNVHRYFMKQPLVDSTEAGSLAHRMDLSKWHRRQMPLNRRRETPGPNDAQNETTHHLLAGLLKRLHKAVSQHWPAQNGKPAKLDPGIVKTIHVSTFGFSRGATQARAFTNWLMSLCQLDAELCGKSGMTLGGFPVQFDFLGIFDTVASVGAGNSFGNTFWGRIFDGHGAWADSEENLRVPEGLPCMHLVAAHEIRRSFPLDSASVKGILPSACEEIVVPGVHSDIGSGYCPTEQGRGIDPDGADMLARIPLIHMYRAARLAGVPLKLELASDVVKKRFAVTPAVIDALNAYLALCEAKEGSLTEIMREQTRLRILYHRARRVSGKAGVDTSASFKRATNFDKNDLHSAYLELDEEIKEFEAWMKTGKLDDRLVHQEPGFRNQKENEWKEIASWWKTASPLPDAAVHFFDEYVHDSRAWFKLSLSDPDNEPGMLKKLESWGKRLRDFESAPTHDETGAPKSSGLTPDQTLAAREYIKTGAIPRMPTEGREDWEIAGYLRYRKVYAGADAYLISKRKPAANGSGLAIHA